LGGVTWKDVYDYLKLFDSDPAPGVVGGDPLVGVSGWLLGGGYSLLTNRFGLGADNVIEFRGILPSKGICNINHKETPEIFMALKVRLVYHDTREGLHLFDWEGRRA